MGTGGPISARTVSLAEAITGRQVRFRHWDCEVACGHYANGRLAIVLLDRRDGSPVATATVNVVELDGILQEDQVFVKDYGENEGMMAALKAADVVEPTGDVVVIGWVTAKVARVLGEAR